MRARLNRKSVNLGEYQQGAILGYITNYLEEKGVNGDAFSKSLEEVESLCKDSSFWGTEKRFLCRDARACGDFLIFLFEKREWSTEMAYGSGYVCSGIGCSTFVVACGGERVLRSKDDTYRDQTSCSRDLPERDFREIADARMDVDKVVVQLRNHSGWTDTVVLRM